MWQQIELHSIQTNMQRAGRQAKKDNLNGAKSSKGSASANQNVININLGDLNERGERKRPRAKKKKDDRPPKKPRAAKAKPVKKKPTKKKPVAKPDVERLVDLKKQYTELTRSVDMRMIPEGCRDVPDRLLTPTTPEQVRELIRYLEDCIRKIRLTSSRGMTPPSGISVSPTPGMPPPPPPGAGGIRLPGMPTGSTYAQQVAEQQRREKEEKERKEKEEKERKEKEEKEGKEKEGKEPPKTDDPSPDTPEKPPKDDPSSGDSEKPPKTVQVVQDEGAFNMDVIPPELGGRNAPEVRQFVEDLMRQYKSIRQQMLASIRGRESETSDDVVNTVQALWAHQLKMAVVLDVIDAAIQDENLSTFTPATRQRLSTFMTEQIGEYTDYSLNRDPLPPFTPEQAQTLTNRIGDAITYLPSPWGRILTQEVFRMIAINEGRPYEEVVRDRSTWALMAQYAITAATPIAAMIAANMVDLGAVAGMAQQALAFGAFNAPGMAAIQPVAALGGPVGVSMLVGSGIAGLIIGARQLAAEGQPLPIGNGGDDPGDDDDDDDDAFDAMVRRLDARAADLLQIEQGVGDRVKAKKAYEDYVQSPGRRVLSPYEEDAQMVAEARQLMASTSEDDEKYRLVSQAVNRFLQEQQRFFQMISEQYTPPDLADFAGGVMAGGPGSSLGQPQQPQQPQQPPPPQSGLEPHRVLGNPHPNCYDTHPKLCSRVGGGNTALCIRDDDTCEATDEVWNLRGLQPPRKKGPRVGVGGIQMQPDDSDQGMLSITDPETAGVLEGSAIGLGATILAGMAFRNPLTGVRFGQLIGRIAGGLGGEAEAVALAGREGVVASQAQQQAQRAVQFAQRARNYYREILARYPQGTQLLRNSEGDLFTLNSEGEVSRVLGRFPEGAAPASDPEFQRFPIDDPFNLPPVERMQSFDGVVYDILAGAPPPPY
jgi:hypothetical protein